MSVTLSGYLAVLFLHKFSRGLGCGLCVFLGLRFTGGPVQSTFTFAVVPENVEQICLCRFHKVLNYRIVDQKQGRHHRFCKHEQGF